jgi:hypothetical protein
LINVHFSVQQGEDDRKRLGDPQGGRLEFNFRDVIASAGGDTKPVFSPSAIDRGGSSGRGEYDDDVTRFKRAMVKVGSSAFLCADLCGLCVETRAPEL